MGTNFASAWSGGPVLVLPLVTQLTVRHKDMLKNGQELASLKLECSGFNFQIPLVPKQNTKVLAAEDCSIFLSQVCNADTQLCIEIKYK